jgi:hypothetical protein
LKKGGNVGEEAMKLFATRLKVSTVFLLLAIVAYLKTIPTPPAPAPAAPAR